MATTKLILTHDVERLGSAGDVVEVKSGYARNYLVPRGFATKWTKGAQAQIDQMAAARRRREIASVGDARLVRDALAPGCRIIGIQSSAAPAAHRAWTSGEPATVHSRTRVAGLAVGASFALTQSVLGRSLNDFILVDDDAIQGAVGLLATHAHTLAEGAGAASLAGLMADPTRQGPCAIVCTGGNADDHELAGISAGSGVGTDATLNC